ncbi:Pre-mRNA-splicing factor ATP-dependent RNA helicase DEAH10 [Camellia lanceoleosa]|uniref:Pre-mRNA-splicing factor ATP-dependent RNA helicase DEAH10 n=1 Tax=Camellia lanceoleosa TaxID=1840588 RepID=A0ACC0HIY9_9ERIC|nr:Pre-mRNA-splicing factor ATP-dependent RNA helicase DEAH10 [Camellia lanceoleosa]
MALRASVVVGAVNLGYEGVSLEEHEGFGCVSIQKDRKLGIFIFIFELPQFLFNAGFCRDGKIIGITQSRCIAAVSVAKWVAEECGVELGQKVGYSVRFDDMTSSSTRVKYMTDGFLSREALLDPYLSRYAVIIVDEAHERTVHTDVLLGLLKSVQNVRSRSVNQCPNIDHMKANNGVMMEKENDAESTGILKQYQGTKFSPLKLIIIAKAVHVQGRQFPVDILHTYHPEIDCIDAALIAIFQIHLEEGPGDILVFLTGQEEIEYVEKLVQESLRQLPEDNQKLKVLPIVSSLPSEKQIQVFMPPPTGFHKVILATNIAETSITIPGIKYVVDPRLVKARTYRARTGMKSLIFVPTSKAQALQRSGRAGREGPGKCFHLYPEIEFEKLRDSTIPEITRCNLSNIILQLKALGVDDIFGFDFMEKPSRDAVIKSLEILVLLDAITE